jgi:hypothetical protein
LEEQQIQFASTTLDCKEIACGEPASKPVALEKSWMFQGIDISQAPVPVAALELSPPCRWMNQE